MKLNAKTTKKLTDKTSRTITFIGGGNMAASLIGGLVADGYDPKHIVVSDPDSDKLASLAARFAIRSAADNASAVERADVVILAVKPQALRSVASDLTPAIQRHKPLIVSIAAGVREKEIQAWLGGDLALVRTMPNT
ncbi:MAG: NAD(P)-binding domain-containing protein, partial [Candidatus Sedimenticola sp. 6PFRAG1]